MTDERPALVVLAAGASRRLGSPKALARLAGRTVLERLLAAAREHTDGAPLVVVGAHAERIRAAAPADCELRVNAEWARGRSGGLALAARQRPSRDLLVAPVDVPLVPGTVFAALVRHWLAVGAPARGWLAPCVSPPAGPGAGPSGTITATRSIDPSASTDEAASIEELDARPVADATRARPSAPAPARRFGHPIVIGRELALELAYWPAERPLRELRARADPLLALEVDAAEILDDLDTPEDLRALAERLERGRPPAS